MRNSRSHNANFNSFFSLDVYILLSSKKKRIRIRNKYSPMKKKIHNERLFSDIFSFRPKREKILATFFSGILLIYKYTTPFTYHMVYTQHLINKKKTSISFSYNHNIYPNIFMVNVKTPRISSQNNSQVIYYYHLGK